MTAKHPGGRPRGSRNKATIARERGLKDAITLADEAGVTPLEIVLRVMAGDTDITAEQLRAAEIALPYFHAKLAPKQPDPPGGIPPELMPDPEPTPDEPGPLHPVH